MAEDGSYPMKFVARVEYDKGGCIVDIGAKASAFLPEAEASLIQDSSSSIETLVNLDEELDLQITSNLEVRETELPQFDYESDKFEFQDRKTKWIDNTQEKINNKS